MLLVDDSIGDVRLTQEAFAEANPLVDIEVAGDGVEAMAFLRPGGRQPAFAAPRPDPARPEPAAHGRARGTGADQGRQIKGDESLKLIPTVILTTSDSEADILRSYELQANSYLSKPVQLDAFDALVRGINDFWLNTAKLPHSAGLAT